MADIDLADDVRSALAWSDQIVGRVSETEQVELGLVPPTDIVTLDELRPRLAAVGIFVPEFPDANSDPMGNLAAWRDFLAPLANNPEQLAPEPLILAPPPPVRPPKFALRLPRGVSIVMAIAIAGGVGYGGGQWTMNLGWEFAQELAIEHKFCAPPSNCQSAADEVIGIMAEEYQLSTGVTQWCLGTAKWDMVEMNRGGFLKSVAVWGMSVPCGSMFGGESAVKPL